MNAAGHINCFQSSRNVFQCTPQYVISGNEHDPFIQDRLFHVTGREHLTAKTMHAFDYAYRQHLNEFDWFIKADDDTYLIVENLRYMLSAHSPQEPVYFGHHFKTIVNQGKRFMYCGPNLRAHMCIYNATSNIEPPHLEQTILLLLSLYGVVLSGN